MFALKLRKSNKKKFQGLPKLNIESGEFRFPNERRGLKPRVEVARISQLREPLDHRLIVSTANTKVFKLAMTQADYRWVAHLHFFENQLSKIVLNVVSNLKPEDWVSTDNDSALELHQEILCDYWDAARKNFDWGKVSSEIDTKTKTASLVITYK